MLAQPYAIGQPVAHTALCRRAATQQRQRDTYLALQRSAVGDVEHRGHAVAVCGIESSWGEKHVVHHIGVDDAQPLLLAAAYELRTVYLDTVDVY